MSAGKLLILLLNTVFLTQLDLDRESVIEVVTIWTGVNIAARWKNGLAYTGTIYFIPNILGSILVSALPWSNRAGLLASVYITGVGTTGFVLSLAWVNQTTAGHTKRITTNVSSFLSFS